MALHASWAHGNGLVVESPELTAFIRHPGWGTEVGVKPGKAVWVHLPIPTPVFAGGPRATILRAFLLFNIPQPKNSIRALHIYDGATAISVTNNLHTEGSHLGIDAKNTITFPTPKALATGLGISILFQAAIGFDTDIGPQILHVAAAGADFEA